MKPKNIEFFGNFPIGQTHPRVFVCIRTCSNASEQIRMGPKRSERVRKLRETCENFENFAKRGQTFSYVDIYRGPLLATEICQMTHVPASSDA